MNSRATIATESVRTPPRLPRPSAARPTTPIAAALTTLGSGRASSTKAATDTIPKHDEDAARHAQ